MPKNLSDYTYGPRPLTTKPLKRTPLDQTRIMPSTSQGTGKLGGLGSKVTGGSMNGGGKRRPSSPRI